MRTLLNNNLVGGKLLIVRGDEKNHFGLGWRRKVYVKVTIEWLSGE